ncbi:uncharacterized protein LOC143461687 [Clavelina lepadiformis]|uniref:uncharacterized protein LOC143461687 n=1 Tax=Clavelina lepadiformis TaxID=159417 RepID=UPI0040432CA3
MEFGFGQLLVLYQVLAVVRCELNLKYVPARLLDAEHILEPDNSTEIEEYFTLGHYLVTNSLKSNSTESNNVPLILVARSKDSGDELRPPTQLSPRLSFHSVTEQKISVSTPLSIFDMTCPDNYVSVGGLAGIVQGMTLPHLDPEDYRCVHENFTDPVHLSFFFYNQSLKAIWPIPSSTPESVGGFFAVGEIDPDRLIIGYRLKPALIKGAIMPNRMSDRTDTTTGLTDAYNLVSTTRQQRSMETTSATSTTSTTASARSRPRTPPQQDNVTIIIVVVAVVIIFACLSIISVRACRKYECSLRGKKNKPITDTLSTEPSDFVYCGAQQPPDGQPPKLPRTQDDGPELKINILYQQTTPNEIGAKQRDSSYVETVINPIYSQETL